MGACGRSRGTPHDQRPPAGRYGSGSLETRVFSTPADLPPSRGSAAAQYERSESVAATDDLSSQRFYHGTRADLKPGDLIEPGHASNFGKQDTKTAYVYLTGTLDAAVWGAELALGEGPGRIYMVEPTGPIMDDPNLTDTDTRVIRRSHTAPGSHCGSRAKSHIGRGTPPKWSKP